MRFGAVSGIVNPTVPFGFVKYPTVRFGAVIKNRKPYGAVRCGSVGFSDIVNPTVRFGLVINPTVRVGAVFRNRKCYSAVWCGFRKSEILRCGSVL